MLHRRTSFALASATLALPALARAQSAQQIPTARPAQQGTPNDRTTVAIASHFALISARLGVERATGENIRRFAQLEAAEQEAAIAAMELAGVSVPREYTLPPEKNRMLQQLQAQRGEGFDGAFLDGQKTGHEELLALHTRVARAAETPGERIISTMAVPAIRSHLVMIEMLRPRAAR